MRPRPQKPVTTPETRTPRVHVQARVTCHIELAGTGEAAGGPVLNLSPGGLLASVDRVLPPDSECEVRLIFGGDLPDVRVSGWVVYANQNGLAVQFDHLTPVTRHTIERITARFVETG